MVRAGSEGAFLEDALRRTADFLELQEELKGRIVGAMFYPAFLAIVGSVITVVLIVFFVPKFAELFERLEKEGGGLPLATVMTARGCPAHCTFCDRAVSGQQVRRRTDMDRIWFRRVVQQHI